MEQWLKDKKNLPIVVGMAIFAVIVAGGLIALELGLFNGGSSATATTVVVPTPVTGAPGAAATGGPPGVPNPNAGLSTAASPAGGKPAGPGGIAAAPVAPALVNPAVGPDPFSIPGGHKIYTQSASAQGSSTTPTLRDILPPFNLFTIRPPVPPVAPGPEPANAATASNYVLSGIVNSGDGTFAILEVGGQSQPVKPGDSLMDGGKVLSIQSTSVTVRSAGGATVTVPLTGGSGGNNQAQNPSNGGQPVNGGQPFNGPPDQGQPPSQYTGQPGQFGGPPEPGQFTGPPDPGMQ